MQELQLSTIIMYAVIAILLIVALVFLFKSFYTVEQGKVAVIVRFGKFRKVSHPGLNMKNPIMDRIYSHVPVQNRSTQLDFQAITVDQANVYFKAMLLFTVLDNQEETIKQVAFKFNSDKEFETALDKTIEGCVRSFVATKKQAEILNLRIEIVTYVKLHLDEILKAWGYHLLDLQVNDISFDKEIMASMSKVVSSSNLRAAAENEGAALLITRTKAAEADGNYIKIQAGAEKEAAQLRGEGVAAFRKAVSEGIAKSAHDLKEEGVDVNVIMFSMWTEAVKNFAEVGKGNVIFLDGSPEGMDNNLKHIMAMVKPTNGKVLAPVN